MKFICDLVNSCVYLAAFNYSGKSKNFSYFFIRELFSYIKTIKETANSSANVNSIVMTVLVIALTDPVSVKRSISIIT